MKTPITPGEILLEDYLEPMGIWSPRRPIFAALRYQLVAAATYLRCASVRRTRWAGPWA